MRLVKLYTGAFLEYEYIYVNPEHVIALEDATEYDDVDKYGDPIKSELTPYKTTITTTKGIYEVEMLYDDVAEALMCEEDKDETD
jgi:hypothetical protein